MLSIGTCRWRADGTTLYYALPPWILSLTELKPLVDAIMDCIGRQHGVLEVQRIGPDVLVILAEPDELAAARIEVAIAKRVLQVANHTCEFYLVDR